ncbi:MAG: aldose 1-epimerase family protein [Sporolactobacillus sp.]
MQLTNDWLQVTVAPLGAEIQSVTNRQEGFEYLWNGNPNFWPRHAPILFPSIGNSNEDVYYLNDRPFKMTQHGFARDYPFEQLNTSETHVSFCQKDCEKTYELFPFHYSLQIDYDLVDNQLRTNFRITNLDELPMPFSIGSHPAFNVPINYKGNFEDYYLRTYPKVNQLMIFETTLRPKPFRSGRIVGFGHDYKGLIHLTHDLFHNGLLIFQNPGIDSIELFSPKTKHSITLNIKEFPYFTLWTTEDYPSPFLCIEPFAGLPDVFGKSVDWYQKEGNQTIDMKKQLKIAYSISFD